MRTPLLQFPESLFRSVSSPSPSFNSLSLPSSPWGSIPFFLSQAQSTSPDPSLLPHHPSPLLLSPGCHPPLLPPRSVSVPLAPQALAVIMIALNCPLGVGPGPLALDQSDWGIRSHAASLIPRDNCSFKCDELLLAMDFPSDHD